MQAVRMRALAWMPRWLPQPSLRRWGREAVYELRSRLHPLVLPALLALVLQGLALGRLSWWSMAATATGPCSGGMGHGGTRTQDRTASMPQLA